MDWGPITRRAALLQFAAASYVQAQPDSLLLTLRPTHPRLLWLPEDVQRTREVIRDNALARKCVGDLEREAERLQNVPPLDYKLLTGRAVPQSHRVLDRIYTLSLLFRLNGKEAHLDRAVEELRAVAAWKDWNAAHLPELAELAHAVGIGYDWLYPYLTEGDRTRLRQAIVRKGLEPSLAAYANPGSFAASRYSLNLVCNAGLVVGALAVGSTDPSTATAVLKGALESVPKSLGNYGPDGGWPEGPGYWQYGTNHAAVMLAALDSALGRDFTLSTQSGFSKTGRFRVYFTGPSYKVFNYSDTAEDASDEPAMFWMAREYAQPVYSWQQTKLAERVRQADPLDLVWFQKDSKPPQGSQWPLDQVFSGVPCAFFRSSWEDPNALFLGVKGGDNKAPHAHLDLGSFVLDAGGVRWAADLGPDDYNLPGYFGKSRWQYYRTRTESHNTVLVDGENQDWKAEARITRREFGTDASWVQVDLSRAYPGRVKAMFRRIGLVNRQAALVEDTVTAAEPVELLWGMMTDAEVSLSGSTATLTKGTWTLEAKIRTPRHAVFDVISAQAAPPQGQNTGFKRLVIRLGERVTDLDLSVLLTPYKSGQPKPRITAAFPETEGI